MSDAGELEDKWRHVEELTRAFSSMVDLSDPPVDPAVRTFAESLTSEVVRMTAEMRSIMSSADEKTRHMPCLASELQNQNEMLRQQLDVLTSLVNTRDRSTSRGNKAKDLLSLPDANPGPPARGHRRVLSHHAVEEIKEAQAAQQRVADDWEVDVKEYFMFVDWQNAGYTLDHGFLRVIVENDVLAGMDFGPEAKSYAAAILEDIQSSGAVALEPLGKKGEPVACALCPEAVAEYKLNLSATPALFVSQVVRNRVAAVCEMFHYIKFLRMQLPEYNKMKAKDIYLKIQQYRYSITLARLGLGSGE